MKAYKQEGFDITPCELPDNFFFENVIYHMVEKDNNRVCHSIIRNKYDEADRYYFFEDENEKELMQKLRIKATLRITR